MLLAAVITICIIASVWYLGGCKAAGSDTRWRERQWIEQRKKEEKEFDGWKYCEDDCYMCDYQGSCRRSAMRKL
jgi:hypothetical protein